MGFWDESLSLCKHAQDLAVRHGDLKEAGWRAYQAGYIYFLREQQPELDACVENASRFWGRPDTMQREKNALIRLSGLSHWLRRDHDAAINDFQTALSQDRALNLVSRDVEKDLRDLSGVYRDLGETVMAKLFADKAYHVTAALGESETGANRAQQEGLWQEAKREWTLAEAFFRQALELSVKVGRKDLIASNSRHLASVLIHQGKRLEAQPHAHLAIQLYQKFGSPKLKIAFQTLQECEGVIAVNGILETDTPTLQVGQPAPDFSLLSREGELVSLKEHKGKWVVLYFYPRDFTSDCTLEAHNFERDRTKYDSENALVLGVSADTVRSHKEFCATEGLNLKLLADPELKVATAYGSAMEHNGVKVPSRQTFLIDPEGNIARIYLQVAPAGHSEEILKDLAVLKKG
jgi:peroxiredoxin Q/BCP